MARVDELFIKLSEETVNVVQEMAVRIRTILAIGENIIAVVDRDCEKLREEAYLLGTDVDAYLDHLIETGSIPAEAGKYYRSRLRYLEVKRKTPAE